MELPAVVMIHGMWSRPAMFASLRRDLEAAGIQSVALTLPHHDLPAGAPPPPALGRTSLADYLAALQRETRELARPFVILGHSMGGLLTQQLAAETRPAGLILLATAASAQAGAWGARHGWATVPTFWAICSRWRWWDKPTRIGNAAARYGIFNDVPEEEIIPALADLCWDSGTALREMALPLLDPQKSASVPYHRLTMPALVLTGLDDHAVPATVSRRTARLLSQAGSRVDYAEWPNVGHWLFHDAVRPRLVSAIAHFLATLTGQSAA